MPITDPNDPDRRDRAPAAATAGGGVGRWLPWLLAAIALVILILALRGCDDDRRAADVERASPGAGTASPTAGPVGAEAAAWDSEAFGRYLAGSEPVGRTFVLDRITFASGSSLIRNEAQAQIAEVAAALRARPSARVRLRGYADPEGDAEANRELSETRTQAVRNALIRAGAAPEQIAAASAMGETGETASEANRRVEITLTAR